MLLFILKQNINFHSDFKSFLIVYMKINNQDKYINQFQYLIQSNDLIS